MDVVPEVTAAEMAGVGVRKTDAGFAMVDRSIAYHLHI